MSATSAFGPYLDTKELLRHRGEESAVPSVTTSELSSSAISLLMGATFPSQVSAMLEDSGMDLDTFRTALAVLQRVGLIDVSQESQGQVIDLTDQGRELRPT